MKRVIIIGIDDILNLFKDYLGTTYLPADVMPTKFRVSEGERKIEVLVESDQWPEGDQGKMRVDFQLKRVFGVGGTNGGQ